MNTISQNKINPNRAIEIKNRLLTITFMLSISFSVYAQLTEHILSNNFDDVQEAVIGDIDGDGDMDVFFTESGLHWFEQVDINQNEWILHSLGGHNGKLELIDVDNDGDLDFVTHGSGQLRYYENLNGIGTETEEHLVFEFSTLNTWAVTELADIDGDGDLDFVGDGLAWAENIDGQFTFGVEQLIYEIPIAHSVSFDMNLIDWDQDDDIDIVLNLEVASRTNQIKILRNIGAGQFNAPETLIDSFPSWDRAYTRAVDVDNDMDIDIIVHNGPADIVWFKNDNGIFGNSIFIHEYFDVPADLEIVDIDQDGLLDIFWCGHGGVFWKKNLGDFTFNPEAISIGPDVDNEATNEITFGDLDLDGDQDMLRMGRKIGAFPQRFSWYENTFPIVSRTNDVHVKDVKLYPNPLSNLLHVQGHFENLELYNAQGIKIYQANAAPIDLSALPNGFYLARLQLNDGNWLSKNLLKMN